MRTPFSKSGFWLDWKRDGLDPAASLLQAYTRVLRERKPARFILENVYALTYNNKASRPAFERLLREIDEAGYTCNWQVLNAADYGVPQLRPRLFVVGAPKGERRRPSCPSRPTAGSWERRTPGNGQRPTSPPARRSTVSSATPEPERGGRGAMGPPAAGHPARRQLPVLHREARPSRTRCSSGGRRYWSFLLKLAPDKPSPTIQAQPGPERRPVPLGQPAAAGAGAEAAVHLPRRLRVRRRRAVHPGADRQLRAAAARAPSRRGGSRALLGFRARGSPWG